MTSDPTNVVGRRVAAYLIDGLAMYVVAAAIVWLLGEDLLRVESDGQVSVNPVTNLTLSALLAFFLLLQVLVLEGLYGYTLGKLAMQVRVVRPMGDPPGPLRAFVRYIAWIIDGFPWCLPLLGFGLALGTNSHRRVGDILADTYVVDAVYAGRAILNSGGRMQAGPHSLRPEDLGVSREELQAALAARPKDPVYDKNLDTYVVWNKKQERMLRFDKPTQTWVPLEQP